RIRNHSIQDGRIEDHDGSGDTGHANGHQGKQFAPGHILEVRLDDQRRLHHPEKDRRRGSEAERTANIQALLKNERKRANDVRKNPPIEKNGRESANHEHERQRLKSENEVRPRILQHEWRRPAAEIAENEGRSRSRRRVQSKNHIVQQDKESFEKRDVEKNPRNGNLNDDAGKNRWKFNAGSLLANDPGDGEEHNDAKHTLKTHNSILSQLSRSNCKISPKARRFYASHQKKFDHSPKDGP